MAARGHRIVTSDNETPVRVERREGWAELVLDRPERRNAITGPVVHGLLSGLDELEQRADAGAVVLRGEGPVFCSGLDLKQFGAQPSPPWLEAFPVEWAELHERLWATKLPTIAVVNGAAVAAGAALAIACDFLVIGESAHLAVPEVRMGLPAPLVGVWLTRRFGSSLALRLTLTTEAVGAADLAALGVADRVLPDPDLLDGARSLAAQLASYPAGAIAAMKDVIRAASGPLGAHAAVGLKAP